MGKKKQGSQSSKFITILQLCSVYIEESHRVIIHWDASDGNLLRLRFHERTLGQRTIKLTGCVSISTTYKHVTELKILNPNLCSFPDTV